MTRNPVADLPKGIHKSWSLPNQQLGTLWESIIVDNDLKTRLLSQAVMNFTVRPKVARTVLPLHGVILLVGPPGTGKTSLARGLANRAAQSFNGAAFRLLEVEPHSLTSSAMGKTQRAVSDLFAQSIAESAVDGPTIVLLDEVETLAVDRSKLSLEANPVDIHRATDAVLVQLDMLAEQFPNLLFLATSNFPKAIDSAFTSRCDLVVQVPLPDHNACKQILQMCLLDLSEQFPQHKKLMESDKFDDFVAECVGLDGRALRKLIANAMASNADVAMDPNRLTIEDLISTAKYARVNRSGSGSE